MMKRMLTVLAFFLLTGIARATVTGTDSTAPFTCTNSTGPFPFTFPALNTGALRVIEQAPGALPGVMTVLPSNAWTATSVNNSYANGGSVTLVTPCPSGYTLTIARVTEPTQLTQYTPYMPALYANVENNLDQLTTGRQDSFRVNQLYPGQIAGGGTVTVTHTPLGQFINMIFPSGSGGSGVAEIIPGTNITCSPNIAGICAGNVTLNASGGLSGGASGTLPIWTSANTLGNSPLSVAASEIVSADPFNAPTLISPLIGLDPNFSTDSIYMQAGGTSQPIIAFTTTGNHLHLNTLGSGGSVDMFVGNANFASYRFLITSLVLGELNGGVGNFAIDCAPSSSGVPHPVPCGTRWHLGTSGALSGSFFQDITSNAWHFNTNDVGASTATDVVTITQAGTLGTKPVTFATLPACAAGTEGYRAAVTDSSTATYGATITGGGSNHIPGYCNGSVWVVQ